MLSHDEVDSTQMAQAAAYVGTLLGQFPRSRTLEPKVFACLAGICSKLGVEVRIARRELAAMLSPKVAKESVDPTISQALARTEKFVALLPPVPPHGLTWRIRRQRDGNDVYVFVKAEVSGEAAPPVPVMSPAGPAPPVRVEIRLKRDAWARGQGAFPATVTVPDCLLVSAPSAKQRLTVTASFSVNEWEFPGGERERTAFAVAVDRYWKTKAAVAEKAGGRIWDGRLWGVDEVVPNPKPMHLKLSVSRVRYRSALYLLDHWHTPVDPLLCERKQPKHGFTELLRLGTINASDTPAPVSLLRLGVVVYLRRSQDFVITRFKDQPPSLAGRGLMFSLMTPEPAARPRPIDQVRRRLVEDLGLAVDNQDIEFLGYARFARFTRRTEDRKPLPPDHVLFARVIADLDREQLQEIFAARRYDQFVDKPEFVARSDVPEALAKHVHSWDPILRLGLGLFLVRAGFAKLRTLTNP